ncbi:hypothetical protein [Luteibaculum oceani]|uniref:Transporter n=1 Tax=Luteibaculum oceani TaxID=1294296 RepID=A0A5C6V0E0_9FLAO|nr:hypothetical protein [Luteibaculum oceani]TXC78639.1 hypothetical protein FRX97_07945 [Luteibaculum oceani]
MRKLLILSSLLYSSLTHGQFLLDGFKSNSGEFTVAASSGVQHFKRFYAAPGKVGVKRSTQINSLYFSGNLTNFLRIAGSLPHFRVIKSDVSSFQDATVQAQLISPYSLWGLRPYFIYTYSQPLSSYATETATAIGQQAFVRGYGGGLQWTGKQYFAALSYQAQDKNPPTPSANQYHFRGGYFQNAWFYSLTLEIQKAIGGSDYRDGSRQPFTTLGADYTKLSTTVYKRITNQFGISANIGQVISGRNVGQSTELFIGLVWNSKI